MLFMLMACMYVNIGVNDVVVLVVDDVDDNSLVDVILYYNV